jgi:excinuclease ABC subunit C
MRKTVSLYKHLPECPGIYIMKDVAGAILYIGKAGNLRRRVSSYFNRPHDGRIQRLVQKIHSIEHRVTDTALEALILESAEIKKHQPPFNILEKDDKSFLYVVIMNEPFPRVLLARGKGIEQLDYKKKFGPFVSASHVREALRIMRKIFPWHTHAPDTVGTYKRPCFDCEVGICPGTCVNGITKKEYASTIRNLITFFEGNKTKVARALEKEMKSASNAQEYERAEKIKRRLFALQHIQDTALISDSEIMDSDVSSHDVRIEGYDISNISGTSAVGSMVVFVNGMPVPDEYRKFKIRTIMGPNDVGMLREVLIRRLHNKWTMPDLILVDGGKGQVNVVREVLMEEGISIPVVGIAKGAERKKNELIGTLPASIQMKTLIEVRDEAHRYAITYHENVRRRAMFN